MSAGQRYIRKFGKRIKLYESFWKLVCPQGPFAWLQDQCRRSMGLAPSLRTSVPAAKKYEMFICHGTVYSGIAWRASTQATYYVYRQPYVDGTPLRIGRPNFK